jgi:hypothetical protein
MPAPSGGGIVIHYLHASSNVYKRPNT